MSVFLTGTCGISEKVRKKPVADPAVGYEGGGTRNMKSIPVGCVPPASVAISGGGCLPRGCLPGGVWPLTIACWDTSPRPL